MLVPVATAFVMADQQKMMRHQELEPAEARNLDPQDKIAGQLAETAKRMAPAYSLEPRSHRMAHRPIRRTPAWTDQRYQLEQILNP